MSTIPVCNLLQWFSISRPISLHWGSSLLRVSPISCWILFIVSYIACNRGSILWLIVWVSHQLLYLSQVFGFQFWRRHALGLGILGGIIQWDILVVYPRKSFYDTLFRSQRGEFCSHRFLPPPIFIQLWSASSPWTKFSTLVGYVDIMIVPWIFPVASFPYLHWSVIRSHCGCNRVNLTGL